MKFNSSNLFFLNSFLSLRNIFVVVLFASHYNTRGKSFINILNILMATNVAQNEEHYKMLISMKRRKQLSYMVKNHEDEYWLKNLSLFTVECGHF